MILLRKRQGTKSCNAMQGNAMHALDRYISLKSGPTCRLQCYPPPSAFGSQSRALHCTAPQAVVTKREECGKRQAYSVFYCPVPPNTSPGLLPPEHATSNPPPCSRARRLGTSAPRLSPPTTCPDPSSTGVEWGSIRTGW